jgi:NADH-quinone oxidoreductase subunit J
MSLIIVFFLSGLILIAFRAEFLGYMLIIVYVGAIAILFLFVVMTIDINREEANYALLKNTDNYTSQIIGIFFMLTVLFITVRVFEADSILFKKFSFIHDYGSYLTFSNSLNTVAISLYTFHFLYMVLAGLLLLVAMIGAVILTLDKKRLNQNSQKQHYQSFKKSGVSNRKNRKNRK